MYINTAVVDIGYFMCYNKIAIHIKVRSVNNATIYMLSEMHHLSKSKKMA